MNQTVAIIIFFSLLGFALAGLLPVSKYNPEFAASPVPFDATQIIPNQGYSPQNNLQLNSFSLNGAPACQAGGKLAVDLLLDTSSSMTCANSHGARCKIEALKDAVTDFAKGLDDNALVGVQTLEKDYIPFAKFSSLKTDFADKIKRLPMGNGTPTSKGLNFAKTAITNAKAQNPDYSNWVLILLTDGCPNTGEKPLVPAAEIKGSGLNVRIVTVGLELGSAEKCKDWGGINGAQKLMTNISSPGDYIDAESDNLTAKFDDVLHKAGQCVTASTCTPQDNFNVDLLVDTSGSMEDNMDNLKIALRSFSSKLTTTNKVGLQSFSGGGPRGVLQERLPLGTYDNAKFISAVNSLSEDEDGYTYMKDAFTATKQKLDSFVGSSGYSGWNLVFLSDGTPETKGVRPDSSQNPSSVASELKSKGIKITTIALGDKADKNLMRNLATDPAKNYFEAKTSDDLSDIYSKVFSSTACTTTSTKSNSPAASPDTDTGTGFRL